MKIGQLWGMKFLVFDPYDKIVNHCLFKVLFNWVDGSFEGNDDCGHVVAADSFAGVFR